MIPSLKKVTPWALVVSTEDSLPVPPYPIPNHLKLKR